mmetsp:Transcript_146055/g.468420  ORF Transcript_146055/g.468420 Transcript_146055/m.468420 type:complete len:273 (+) Transcript_146055:4741-5559(+)
MGHGRHRRGLSAASAVGLDTPLPLPRLASRQGPLEQEDPRLAIGPEVRARGTCRESYTGRVGSVQPDIGRAHESRVVLRRVRRGRHEAELWRARVRCAEHRLLLGHELVAHEHRKPRRHGHKLQQLRCKLDEPKPARDQPPEHGHLLPHLAVADATGHGRNWTWQDAVAQRTQLAIRYSKPLGAAHRRLGLHAPLGVSAATDASEEWGVHAQRWLEEQRRLNKEWPPVVAEDGAATDGLTGSSSSAGGFLSGSSSHGQVGAAAILDETSDRA